MFIFTRQFMYDMPQCSVPASTCTYMYIIKTQYSVLNGRFSNYLPFGQKFQTFMILEKAQDRAILRAEMGSKGHFWLNYSKFRNVVFPLDKKLISLGVEYQMSKVQTTISPAFPFLIVPLVKYNFNNCTLVLGVVHNLRRPIFRNFGPLPPYL